MDAFIDGSALRKKVSIQRRNATKDTFGQAIQTWSDVLVCRASIEPLSGRELVAAQAINAETTHEIVIRYRAGITPAMRVLYGARAFNILSVLNQQERNRWLVLNASEGLTKG